MDGFEALMRLIAANSAEDSGSGTGGPRVLADIFRTVRENREDVERGRAEAKVEFPLVSSLDWGASRAIEDVPFDGYMAEIAKFQEKFCERVHPLCRLRTHSDRANDRVGPSALEASMCQPFRSLSVALPDVGALDFVSEILEIHRPVLSVCAGYGFWESILVHKGLPHDQMVATDAFCLGWFPELKRRLIQNAEIESHYKFDDRVQDIPDVDMSVLDDFSPFGVRVRNMDAVEAVRLNRQCTTLLMVSPPFQNRHVVYKALKEFQGNCLVLISTATLFPDDMDKGLLEGGWEFQLLYNLPSPRWDAVHGIHIFTRPVRQ